MPVVSPARRTLTHNMLAALAATLAAPGDLVVAQEPTTLPPTSIQ